MQSIRESSLISIAIVVTVIFVAIEVVFLCQFFFNICLLSPCCFKFSSELHYGEVQLNLTLSSALTVNYLLILKVMGS